MGFRYFEMAHDGAEIGDRVVLAVSGNRRRNIRGRIAACAIGNAAVAAREVAELRLPTAKVARELMHEDDRITAAGFFVIELHIVVRRIGHRSSPTLISHDTQDGGRIGDL